MTLDFKKADPRFQELVRCFGFDIYELPAQKLLTDKLYNALQYWLKQKLPKDGAVVHSLDAYGVWQADWMEWTSDWLLPGWDGETTLPRTHQNPHPHPRPRGTSVNDRGLPYGSQSTLSERSSRPSSQHGSSLSSSGQRSGYSVEDITEEVNRLRDEVEELKHRRHDLADQLTAAADSSVAATRLSASRFRRIAELERERTSQDHQIQELKEQLANATKQSDNQTYQILTLRQATDDSKAQSEFIRKELHERQEELKIVKEQSNDRQSRLENAEQSCKGFQLKLDAVQQQVQDTEEKYGSELATHRQQLADLRKDSSGKLAQLKQQFDDFRKHNESKLAKLESFKYDVEQEDMFPPDDNYDDYKKNLVAEAGEREIPEAEVDDLAAKDEGAKFAAHCALGKARELWKQRWLLRAQYEALILGYDMQTAGMPQSPTESDTSAEPTCEGIGRRRQQTEANAQTQDTTHCEAERKDTERQVEREQAERQNAQTQRFDEEAQRRQTESEEAEKHKAEHEEANRQKAERLAQRQEDLSRRPEFKVLARIRPGLGAKEQGTIEFPEGEDRKLLLNKSNSNTIGIQKTFTFHRVFQPDAPNAAVFEEISTLIDSVFEGSKVCIFAYGQTGSGKSHTMSAKPDGIIWASIRHIFATPTRLQKVTGSCIEVYKDKLKDLVEPTNKPEIMYKTATVKNLSAKQLDEKDANAMLNKALGRRITGGTEKNATSSRGHFVFRLEVTGNGGKAPGILSLVDLAGAETAMESGTNPTRREEQPDINKSLSVLRRVFEALQRGDERLPHRDHKVCSFLIHHLTHLLTRPK